MQWLLKKCDYDIQDASGSNNKRPLTADLFLLAAYTVLSLYNAVLAWISGFFLNNRGTVPGGRHPTWIVIAINIIVLVRLNISLYLKAKNNMEAEFRKLCESQQAAVELTINTWRIKAGFVFAGYILDIAVGGFCIAFGKQIYSSLPVIVIISIAETCLNGLIDNYEIRYRAVPKVYNRI